MSQVHVAAGNTSDLKLRNAVLLYHGAGPDSTVYATVHEVEIVRNAPHLLPGRPMALAELAQFAEAAQAATAYRGFLDARILYLAPNTMAWWCPAGCRTTWFRADKPIGERHGTTPHPPLVFIVREGKWYVFALAKNERPGPETELRTAPYFNVWERGEICTGNVQLPDRPAPDALHAYEDAFFRSRFTHPNQPRICKYKGGGQALWAHLLDHPEVTKFPTTALLPRKETLEQAIKRISSGA
ncbi:PRTRC system protein B [Ralstonia mannitolilytica]|uniref:PRTRC system protein B n=1 Tax=Ralstonia mannitolilytica TaxID=105219 RepID=UPI0028F5C393|nr:PRTRC system protein B [Ralstonia mannitolilytica]CAJ0740881.1 hypothetical protein R76696_03187 [Ralstonia mannitolilytica]